MELILVTYVAAVTIASLSTVVGCGAILETSPYGAILLEKSLAFMGSVKDHREMAPRGALVRHPKDPPLSQNNSRGQFQSYSKGVKILSVLLVQQHHSYVIPHRRWHIPFHGVRLMRATF